MAFMQEADASYEASDTLCRAEISSTRSISIPHHHKINTESTDGVTETLLGIPSLTISDFGGSSGLKTVNIRGLGSSSTIICIDGIKVGNIQSGQNDLGMIDIENMSSVTVDYAKNSISFNTAKPVFGYRSDGTQRRFNAKASLGYGSFGTMNPYARLNWKISDKTSLSINSTGMISKGDFRYTGTDATEAFRSNNDIRQIRTGADLFGNLNNGSWHVKGFFNAAERGSPGSIEWPSDDRQKDMNTFIQGSFKLDQLRRYNLNASAKISYDYIGYQSSWGDSRYGQTEVQFNTSHLFWLNTHWRISLDLNGTWDRLASESYSRENIDRLMAETGAFAAFTSGKFAAEAEIGYFIATDDGRLRNAFSPSATVRYTPIHSIDIIASSRRTYRIPTFNELYFVGFGNPDLKCEDAWLNNIEIDWKPSSGKRWQYGVNANAFCNLLKDKIASAPCKEDPNIWLPYNIGRVFGYGFDVSSSVRYAEGVWSTGITAGYSLLNAVDRTPDSISYGMQIPYVARHSIVTNADVSYKDWRARMTWNMRNGRNDSVGEMPTWNTFDASIYRNFIFSRHQDISLDVTLKGCNLTNCRYEMSRGYPMPGRSVAVIIGLNF